MINFTDLAGFNWSSPKMYMSNSQSTMTNRSRSAGCLLRFVDLADSANRQCFPFSSTQKCILYALKSNLSHAMVTCCHFWELGVTVSKVSNGFQGFQGFQRFATKHPVELEVVVLLIDQTTFGSGLQALKLIDQLVFTE